jgi:putative heme-binding domain-containing protein
VVLLELTVIRKHAASVLVFALVALLSLVAATADDATDAQAAKDASTVEVLLRLENFNLDSSPPAKAALLRYLNAHRGSERYFQLVGKFALGEEADHLVTLAIEQPSETAGVAAAKLLEKLGEFARIEQKASDADEKTAVAAVTVAGYVGSKPAMDWLSGLLPQTKLPVSVRSAAASGLGRNRSGEQQLLELVESKRLPADLNFAVANILHASREQQIRQRVAKHLQLPASAQGDPLPPLAELVAASGDSAKGREVFLQKGTCIKCHKVAGEGKDVGPDLSEIGSKLSKEAMYVSILSPSAGISHNFETYEVVTVEGQIATGVLVSQTDAEVKLKNAEAIELTFPKDEVDEMNKLAISLMPADLQKNLSVAELTNLVEYLTTLKKKP